MRNDDLSGRPGIKPISILFSLLILSLLAGCASEGDLGRPKHNYWSRTAATYLDDARVIAAMREDPSLPMTAPEDALRERWRDVRRLGYHGVMTDAALSRRGDGYARVSGLTQDINVERQRFELFVVAARKVQMIDDARDQRLKKLNAFEARRQYRLVKQRRRENDVVIREGVREMRRRVKRIRPFINRLSIEAPTVPMDGAEQAFEQLSEDVVRFHAELDGRAHSRLGGGDDAPYK